MKVDGEWLRVDGQRRLDPLSFLTINPRPSTLNHSPSSGCGGGTRLCEGRGPGSTPGEDTFVTTLKSHGVAAACNAASSGFDSHRRLLEAVEGRWLRVEGRTRCERHVPILQPSTLNRQPNAGTVDVDRPAAHGRLGRVSSRAFRTWVLIERHQRLVSSMERAPLC